MMNAPKTRAEERLAATKKAQQEAFNEREAQAIKISKNTARLKALRLAKEAADLAENPPKKPVKRKRATRKVTS